VETSEYIIAVRRDHREDVPADWVRLLTEVEGVSVLGSSHKRAQILANDFAIQRVRLSLGSYLRIEPVVTHQVQ
jgi:hypothetical protein